MLGQLQKHVFQAGLFRREFQKGPVLPREGKKEAAAKGGEVIAVGGKVNLKQAVFPGGKLGVGDAFHLTENMQGFVGPRPQ